MRARAVLDRAGSPSTSPPTTPARRPEEPDDHALPAPARADHARRRSTLRNRVVMGSMHTGLEDRAWDLPKLAAYFAERARGGVGLIITGGYAPTKRGWLKPFASEMTTRLQAMRHREITGAVHDEGGAIALQVLHAGRYGYHPFSVGASDRKSPITPFKPSALSTQGRATDTVDRFARVGRAGPQGGLRRGRDHGLRGLPDQPVPGRAHQRPHDHWGGSAANRMRFPVEIVRRTRGAGRRRTSRSSTGSRCSTWSRTARPGRRPSSSRTLLEEAGVTVLNTGIGWHEARVPTIITQVPRAAWRSATARLQAEVVDVPVCASNRINTPEVAEEILAAGDADLVSMARPLLADPEFVAKAAAGRADEINTCIACNQACLDHVFANRAVLLPGQPARLPRDRRWCSGPDPQPPARSRSSAPDRPASAPRCRPPSAASRSPSSRRSARDRRPVPARDGGSPARRSSPRRCATTAAGSRCSASTYASRPQPTVDRARGLRRGGRRDRRRARAIPDARRASTTRASCRTPTC